MNEYTGVGDGIDNNGEGVEGENDDGIGEKNDKDIGNRGEWWRE